MGSKISDLSALTTAADADALPVVDDDVSTTKKITLANLRDSLNTGAISTVDDADLTASRALVSNGSGKIAVATTTATEIGHVNGVTSAIQSQLNVLNTRPVLNLIANGNFDIWDLGASPTPNDNDHFCNGWRLVTSTASRSVSRSASSPPDGSRYFASIAGADANENAGIVFVIPSALSIPLRGKSVSLRGYVKGNQVGSPNIYAAILAWTGTADAATADLVSSWGALPTLIANYTYENTPGAAMTQTGWTQLSAWDTGLIGVSLDTAGLNNIVVFIYNNDSLGSGPGFDVAQLQLNVGDQLVDFVPRPLQQERELISKHNWEATGAPGVGDDIADGYGLLSQWADVSADDHYVCLDPTAGAAVWKKTTP